nr:hypothetical protein [Tanacetum cinerariifolium]
MIYENSKGEQRVMIHKEIHKFCDATLKRVLENLKKYNKDMKYGYADLRPSNDDVDYLKFYKEDIEDRLRHQEQLRHWKMYKVNLTAPIITFPGIKKEELFTITFEPVIVPDDKVSQELLEEMPGEIDEAKLQRAVDEMLRQRCNLREEHQYHIDQMQNYLKSDIVWESRKESKGEQRVMIHKEIHKFCDATLKRVLENLKKYNKDMKYGYADLRLSNDDVDYLKFYKEDIEDRLRHQEQLRRWKMYVNGRPL